MEADGMNGVHGEARAARPAGSAWFPVLAGPAAWFLHLTIGYLLVKPACALGSSLPLHAASVVCLTAALAGTWASFRLAEADSESPREAPWETEENRTSAGAERVRFMGHLGVMTGGLFSVIIVAQWVVIAALNPCVK